MLSVREFAMVGRYIGCLENKEDVCRFSFKPIFHIVGKVSKYDISKADMLFLNERGYFERVPFSISIAQFDATFDEGEHLQLAKLQVDIMQRNHPSILSLKMYNQKRKRRFKR